MNKNKLKKTTRQIQMQSTKKSVEIVRLLSLYILKRYFGFGKTRLERFDTYFVEQFMMYNRDYFNLVDIKQELLTESHYDVLPIDDMAKKIQEEKS